MATIKNFQDFNHQGYNQQPHPNYDYINLPLQQMYQAQQPRRDPEFETFKRFLQFKHILDVTSRLEQEGIITINKEEYQEKREDREEKHLTPGKFILILFGICFFAVVVL